KENAKDAAVTGTLPEANHNQVVTCDGPFAADLDGSGEGRAAVPLRLVVLRDSVEHPQVARRREESALLAAERGVGVTELAAADGGTLGRLASLGHVVGACTADGG